MWPRTLVTMARFLKRAGMIGSEPADWKELYLPLVHREPGSQVRLPDERLNAHRRLAPTAGEGEWGQRSCSVPLARSPRL
jgi:hypothetical protein